MLCYQQHLFELDVGLKKSKIISFILMLYLKKFKIIYYQSNFLILTEAIIKL